MQAKDDRFGLPRQRTEVQDYSHTHGFELDKIYSDVITGKTEGRQGLSALLANASQYQAVIAPSVDRLGRTVLTAYNVLEELRKAGLKVHTVQDGLFDPESDSDALTYGMRAIFSEQELRSIKRRMLGGKLARAERGGVIPHGWRCYGWRTVWLSEGGKPVRSIELDPAQAAVAKEVLTRISTGELKHEIADDLNRRGILTLDGAQWSIQRLWYMARNRAYMGEVSMRLKHADRDFTFHVPPIIDEATWQAANDQLKKKPRLSLDMHPLNGLLRCAACGGAMSGQTRILNGRTYSHYRCQRAWKHSFYGAARCDHTTDTPAPRPPRPGPGAEYPCHEPARPAAPPRKTMRPRAHSSGWTSPEGRPAPD